MNAAKKECHRCPSERDCADYGLHWDVSGVWGGLDEKQRKRLRKKLHIVPCPLSLIWASRISAAHGTEARYKKHRRDGEDACGPCVDAASRARGGRKGPHHQCGTIAGYSLHRRRREQVCDACQQAQHDYTKAALSNLPWIRLRHVAAGQPEDPRTGRARRTGARRVRLLLLARLRRQARHRRVHPFEVGAVPHQRAPADAQKLVEVGLWHETVDGGWEINGWAERQESTDETQARRRARSEGRRRPLGQGEGSARSPDAAAGRSVMLGAMPEHARRMRRRTARTNERTNERRVLDLFAGAGGCSVGYARAGFDVTAVDIEPHPTHPLGVMVADALDVLADRGYLDTFDVIHASPPCQAFTAYRRRGDGVGESYPDLIADVRAALQAWGGLYVIENVPGTPLRNPVQFCGSSLGLDVRRHRLFESQCPR
jgi:hypothetical protein